MLVAMPPNTFRNFSADDIEKRRSEWWTYVHLESVWTEIASAGYFELRYLNGSEATTARVRLEMREVQKERKAYDGWAAGDSYGSISKGTGPTADQVVRVTLWPGASGAEIRKLL